MDQRVEEAVLICGEAVFTVSVQQPFGNDASVGLYRHDKVRMLSKVLYGVLADLLYLINTVDLFVLFDELSLFVDSLLNIGQLALDHLDPFHVDNAVVSVTGEFICALIGVCHRRYKILARIVAVEGIYHFSISAIVSTVINHGAHSFWGRNQLFL